jgi:hypothetical protein
MLSRLAVASFLFLLAAAALIRLAPRADVDPHSRWSTSDATENLRFIASAPRQPGSDHHRAVREYLVAQFTTLGLQVEVQDTPVAMPMLHRLPIQVKNVVGRLEGTRPGSQAIMLSAHYDTTRISESPGAGDDGAAVAALLEVARVLAIDRPANDVIFLITDAEEMGLLGARAFAREHRWRGDVGVVLNFEARGSRGPSIMFETSPQSGRLVEQYARFSPHPVTGSLSADIYKMMPNKTDFTIFRQEGMSGLNFAFIGGYANYHKPTDDLEHLDIASMRHHGVQALALVRAFDHAGLSAAEPSHPVIYFNLFPGSTIIRYSARWAVPLAAGSVLLFVVAAVAARRRSALTVPGTALAAATFLLSIAATIAVCWLLVRLLPLPWCDRNAEICFSICSLVGILATIWPARILAHRCTSGELVLVGLFVWTALALGTAISLRSASYVFTWPAIFGSLAWILSLVVRRAEALIWLLAVVPLVLLITPVMYLSFLAFRVRLAPFTVTVVVLAMWLLAPLLRRDHSAVSGGGGA